MLKLTKSYTSCYSLKNLRILLGGEPMPKKKWGKAFVKKKKKKKKIKIGPKSHLNVLKRLF